MQLQAKESDLIIELDNKIKDSVKILQLKDCLINYLNIFKFTLNIS